MELGRALPAKSPILRAAERAEQQAIAKADRAEGEHAAAAAAHRDGDPHAPNAFEIARLRVASEAAASERQAAQIVVANLRAEWSPTAVLAQAEERHGIVRKAMVAASVIVDAMERLAELDQQLTAAGVEPPWPPIRDRLHLASSYCRALVSR
jgi:hypothetical protein